MKLSIVSPVYRAEKIVDELVKRISSEARKITQDYEIILVEDCGPDNSWGKIEENCRKDSKVKGIKLSRNFGQHYAISAGLTASKGDYVIVMDCDLQDDPVYFKHLLDKVKEGNEIVYTYKKQREHGFLKNLTAYFFFRMYNFLVDSPILKGEYNVGTYSIISRKVVDAYLRVGDYRRHYLSVLRWVGFESSSIIIEHQARYEGKSSYSWGKLITHAIDGIISQSDKILRLTAVFGFILSLISFLAAISIVIGYFLRPFQPGWPSMMVLLLLVGGLIITSVGVCGLYIGKIFEQTKNRPHYVINKSFNL